MILRNYRFLFVMVIMICGGCVSIHTIDKTGITTLLKAAELPVLTDEEAKDKVVIEQVVGHSCKRKTNEPSATEEGARDQAKIAAVNMGATAISNLQCSKGYVSLFKNCWESWECTANVHKD